MKQKLPLLAGFVFLLVGVYFFWPTEDSFFIIDSCLDSGGSYDYERSQCDFQQSHPVGTAKKHFSSSPLLGFVFCGVGLVFLLVGVRARSNKAFKRTGCARRLT